MRVLRAHRSRVRSTWMLVGASICTQAAGAHADPSGNRGAKFASGPGSLVYLAGSLAMPLLEDGHDGSDHALRTADSVLTGTVITEALKHIVREKRPDSPERDSFPSGHATAAFAAASMASHFHPNQSLFWYTGAALIAASRVKLHRHYVHDVMAGAVVGFSTSRLELSQPRGLLLYPFIRRHNRSSRQNAVGMQFSASF